MYVNVLFDHSVGHISKRGPPTKGVHVFADKEYHNKRIAFQKVSLREKESKGEGII
ncbi:hypothetical protein BAT02nite_34390 [Bacillus atrophaeus]|jgi:hypothetical protein|nr:hypothetical protein D068_cds12030 [Bacillus atrophaeus UCMB-5137]GED03795.1 hypothetical protein BAT02nite_34390 [Bacillus atrophaeus]